MKRSILDLQIDAQPQFLVHASDLRQRRPDLRRTRSTPSPVPPSPVPPPPVPPALGEGSPHVMTTSRRMPPISIGAARCSASHGGSSSTLDAFVRARLPLLAHPICCASNFLQSSVLRSSSSSRVMLP